MNSTLRATDNALINELSSFQLLADNFERRFKFGVPKHSDFEPDYFLAKGNGKPPQIAA